MVLAPLGGIAREVRLDPYVLYSVKTWGGEIPELVFEYTNLEREVKYLSYEELRSPEYAAINPVQQVPALRLPSGTVMTESLAISLYLDATGKAGLVPEPSAPEFASFSRWSVFLVAGIYGVAAYADHPDWFVSKADAQRELKDATMKRVQDRFLLLESEARGPWFLGERLTLIDLYLTVMAQWEPGPKWFEENTPRLMEIAERYRQTPQFQTVAARNLKDGT